MLESLPGPFALGRARAGPSREVFRSAEPLLLQTVPAEYLDELSRFGVDPGGVRPDRHPLADAPADRRPRPDARGDDARLAPAGAVRRARSRPRPGARGPAPASRSTTRGWSASCGAAPRLRRRSSSSATASSWSAATGRSGSGIPPPRASPAWRERRRRAARRGGAGRLAARAGERAPQTFPFDGPRGELWLSLTAAEFPHGTVYAFRDLTDERAVEQLKSDFVSTVSHELRTPLAAIYGAAMTLRRDDVVLGHAAGDGHARGDRRRVGAARPDRQRHPAREPARLRARRRS